MSFWHYDNFTEAGLRYLRKKVCFWGKAECEDKWRG